MLQIRKTTSTADKVLPNINTVNGSTTECEEIETFKAMEMSILCRKCSNYVNLENLQDHRTLHDALSLYQCDFTTKPNNEQALCRKRVSLIKNLNKLLNISRSAYCKELGKIDLAYEIIKSEMYGRNRRSNNVKQSFIEHHDVIIRSVGGTLHKGAALGVCESTNEKWRSVMEDAYSYKSEFTKSKKGAYFAVFDGYSGPTAARKCSDQFYQILKETLDDLILDECTIDADCHLSTAFHQAFEDMDNILLLGAEETSRNRWSGCSATTCLLTHDSLHVANVGNVKAVQIRDDDSFQVLSEDHSPANKKEKHRIKTSSDIHRLSKTMWVNGVVMTTRGLGNHGDSILKSNIINVPAVCCVPLSDVGQIILVASYGFWQVFDESDVVVLVKGWLKGKASELAKSTTTNNMKFDKIDCTNSIEIFVQHEEVLNTDSDKDNQMKGQGLATHDFQATKNGSHDHESNTVSDTNPDSSSSSITSDMKLQVQDSKDYDGTKERSILGSLRDLVMRYDPEVVAVGISKHLMKAALTGGAKENISVMIVIRYI